MSQSSSLPFFKRLMKPKPKEPTEAEMARARMLDLAESMKNRVAPGSSRPPVLVVVSSRSLENELDPKETPPRGTS